MSSVDVYDDFDQIVAEHDLAYLHAKSVTDYWKGLDGFKYETT